MGFRPRARCAWSTEAVSRSPTGHMHARDIASPPVQPRPGDTRTQATTTTQLMGPCHSVDVVGEPDRAERVGLLLCAAVVCANQNQSIKDALVLRSNSNSCSRLLCYWRSAQALSTRFVAATMASPCGFKYPALAASAAAWQAATAPVSFKLPSSESAAPTAGQAPQPDTRHILNSPHVPRSLNSANTLHALPVSAADSGWRLRASTSRCSRPVATTASGPPAAAGATESKHRSLTSHMCTEQAHANVRCEHTIHARWLARSATSALSGTTRITSAATSKPRSSHNTRAASLERQASWINATIPTINTRSWSAMVPYGPAIAVTTDGTKPSATSDATLASATNATVRSSKRHHKPTRGTHTSTHHVEPPWQRVHMRPLELRSRSR